MSASQCAPLSLEQPLDRACLRVAAHIRALHGERGSSDTRLLEGLLLPDELVVVGRSLALRDGERPRREHVVPRLVIVRACHKMIELGCSDEVLAAFIRDHTKIVLITQLEAARLDKVHKQTMPPGWTTEAGLFARLDEAKIAWDPEWRPVAGKSRRSMRNDAAQAETDRIVAHWLGVNGGHAGA